MKAFARATIAVFLFAFAVAAVVGCAVYVATGLLETEHEETVAWTAEQVPVPFETVRASFDQALQSDPVLTDALRRLGVEEPDPQAVSSLRDAIRTTARSDTDGGGTLRLHVRGGDPQEASQRASALAAALEEWDRSTAQDRLQETVEAFDAEIDALEERIRVVQVFGNDAGDASLEELLGERDVLVDLREAASRRVTAGSSSGSLARSASDGGLLDERRLRLASIAALVALFVGLGGALLWRIARSSDSVLSPGRGEGVLATFPQSGGRDVAAMRDAAWRLTAEVVERTPDVRRRIILVTSAVEGEGKSTVAAKLAEEFAWNGRRTLLVDANLSAPDLSNRYSLGTLPDGGTTLDWMQNPTGNHPVASVTLDGDLGFDLVPQVQAISVAPGAVDSFVNGFRDALARWERYDAIIVDAPAILAAEETRLLARHATGTIIVVNRREPDERRLAKARRILNRAGASVLGLVSNYAAIPWAEYDEPWSTVPFETLASQDRRDGNSL